MPVDGRSWADVVRGTNDKDLRDLRASAVQEEMLKLGATKEAIVKYKSLRHEWQKPNDSVNRTYPVDDDLFVTFASDGSDVNWKEFMIDLRSHFMPVFQNGGFHRLMYFSRFNALLLFYCRAIISKNTYLLKYPELFMIAVLHICVKTEQRRTENDYRSLRQIQKNFIDTHKRKAKVATKKEIILAEIEILKISGWRLPLVTSYEIMNVIFQRLRILTCGKDKEKINSAQDIAENFLEEYIRKGMDCGFYCAKISIGRSLKEVKFDKWKIFDVSFCDCDYEDL